jgi:hypothetical protein
MNILNLPESILKRYLKNTIEQGSIDRLAYVLKEDKTLDECIKRSFVWERTPEGFAYWKQVCENHS